MARAFPLPKFTSGIPAPANAPVKTAPVNWLPWSVLKISGLPQRANASSNASTQKRSLERVRKPPGQHCPARPVDDGDQIQKALADRDVGDVGRPDLVRTVDRKAA